MKIEYQYNIRTGESEKRVTINGREFVPVYQYIQPAASGCPRIIGGEGSFPSVATTLRDIPAGKLIRADY